MLPLVLLVDISLLLMEVNNVNGIIMPITDNISSVDGIVSDTGGNVNLSAVRYVAQTLEDDQKVQARKNIGVDGQIYPCTATALEGMSTADLVGIYNQGYRAVQTTNNETVVTIALAADGSVEWQGCNEDTTNLLDNPDFAIAQAGHGGMHGVVAYAADRWPLHNVTFTSGEAGKITVTGGDSDGFIYQRFLPPSGPITVGYFDLSENLFLINANVPDVLGEEVTLLAANQNIHVYVNQRTIQVNFVVNADKTVTFSKAFCYSGSYTPKTLPPWEAPDAATEYLKCRRYWRNFDVSSKKLIGVCFYPNAVAVIGGVLDVPMRGLPTCQVESITSIDSSMTYDFLSYMAGPDGVTWIAISGDTPISVGTYVYVWDLRFSSDL